MKKFGEIEGYPEGSVFEDRAEIKSAGLHFHHQYGISRVVGIGSDCIVLNGGYVDDVDNGNEIIYTGEGGRKGEGQKKHTFDQPFTRGNYDLSRNSLSGLPVRIIRGPKLKNSEYKTKYNYRYDGLYYVENYWAEKGKYGFRIWRYRLVKKDGFEVPKTEDINIPKTNANETKRRISQTNTIIRDPEIPKTLKALHDCQCQICGIRLEANGKAHAIGAHVKGLGKPHKGPDSPDNMIILCPNCHYLFDEFAFSINEDFSFLGYDGVLENNPTFRLITKKTHVINQEYISYHRDQYKLRLR